MAQPTVNDAVERVMWLNQQIIYDIEEGLYRLDPKNDIDCYNSPLFITELLWNIKRMNREQKQIQRVWELNIESSFNKLSVYKDWSILRRFRDSVGG